MLVLLSSHAEDLLLIYSGAASLALSRPKILSWPLLRAIANSGHTAQQYLPIHRLTEGLSAGPQVLHMILWWYVLHPCNIEFPLASLSPPHLGKVLKQYHSDVLYMPSYRIWILEQLFIYSLFRSLCWAIPYAAQRAKVAAFCFTK